MKLAKAGGVHSPNEDHLRGVFYTAQEDTAGTTPGSPLEPDSGTLSFEGDPHTSLRISLLGHNSPRLAVFLAITLLMLVQCAWEAGVNTFALGNDVQMDVPSSYVVFTGDVDAFMGAAAPMATERERRHLESLKALFLPAVQSARLPQLFAFRSELESDSGTEMLLIAETGPPVDWSTFPIDQWMADGLPPGASQPTATTVHVDDQVALIRKIFDPSATLQLESTGAWTTTLSFNFADTSYSITATTSEEPSRALTSSLIRIARSTREVTE